VLLAVAPAEARVAQRGYSFDELVKLCGAVAVLWRARGRG
jgi:hypothetical protein